MTTKQKRIKYLIAFLIFLLIEVLIALFIHDDFIRPYIGDVLVETLQYFNIVELLGVEDNTFLSTLIGATFDIKDIICYLVGGVCLCVCEVFCDKLKSSNN